MEDNKINRWLQFISSVIFLHVMKIISKPTWKKQKQKNISHKYSETQSIKSL
jgi:hypothetical protein